jgi:Tfp pilus assembly protein FimT
MQVNSQYTNKAASRSTGGFTQSELIIIVAVIGIMGAIAIPSWLGFVERLHLNIGQDQIYRGMEEAKSNAKLQKVTWQFSVRENNAVVQWAVHPATVNPANAHWHNLDKTIHLDSETTLQLSSGVRKIQFDYLGNVTKPPFGRLTLSSQFSGKTKRCVFVSTIIGTLRTAKEHPKPKDGKYCY